MFDAIVVGAGQAGLAASYFLNRRGLSHVVFERGLVAESWRSQRWDTFMLNTPIWCSHLPGDDYAGNDPDAFYHCEEFVASLEQYQTRFDLPVQTGVEVVHVEPEDDHFSVTIRRDSTTVETLQASCVIAATGLQNVPKIPGVAERLEQSINQLHSADYRAPEQLPDGAVLVVGAGQSGFQIAEDLLESERMVYLSSSKVGRFPRRYRGRDALWWLGVIGILAQKTSELEDPSVIYDAVPHVSGVGPRGRTVSYQRLARMGACIVGRLVDFNDGAFIFAGDAAENVRFADEKSAEFKKAIDDFLTNAGEPIPPLEDDPADEPDPAAACASNWRRLDARKIGITSVVWCTGFKGSFDWIDAPILAEDGRPEHVDGISAIDGLYFLGFPWLRTRGSGIIRGIADDADFIVSHLSGRLGEERPRRLS